jgi:hypothetical protein
MDYLGMHLDDYRILKFENTLGELPRWRKESAIQRTLKMTSVRYYQRLGQLLRDPEALEKYPQLIYRLRAIKSDRHAETLARLID